MDRLVRQYSDLLSGRCFCFIPKWLVFSCILAVLAILHGWGFWDFHARGFGHGSSVSHSKDADSTGSNVQHRHTSAAADWYVLWLRSKVSFLLNVSSSQSQRHQKVHPFIARANFCRNQKQRVVCNWIFLHSPLLPMSIRLICPCALYEDFRRPLKSIQVDFYERVKAIVDSGRYDTRDDFTVVMQPFMVYMDPLILVSILLLWLQLKKVRNCLFVLKKLSWDVLFSLFVLSREQMWSTQDFTLLIVFIPVGGPIASWRLDSGKVWFVSGCSDLCFFHPKLNEYLPQETYLSFVQNGIVCTSSSNNKGKSKCPHSKHDLTKKDSVLHLLQMFLGIAGQATMTFDCSFF